MYFCIENIYKLFYEWKIGIGTWIGKSTPTFEGFVGELEAPVKFRKFGLYMSLRPKFFSFFKTHD